MGILGIKEPCCADILLPHPDAMSSFEEYAEARKQKNRRLIQALTVVSVVAFLGGSIQSFVGMMSRPAPPAETPASPSPATAPVAPPVVTLEEQIAGYEQVLKREPENPAALEMVVNLRIQAQDYRGTVAPLETLARLYPQNQDYPVLLKEMREKAKTQPAENSP